MKNTTLLLIAVFILINYHFKGQITDKNYVIMNKDGERKTIDDIIKATNNIDVVFFGEEHNDSVAHYMELTLFKKMHEVYKEKCVLSVEMFERDAQIILNEYLEGKIIWASRSNISTDKTHFSL